MIAEISASVAALFNASKILAGLNDVIKDAKSREKIVEVQGVISNLQTKLSDVYAQYAELLKSKDEVDAELKKYQNWDATAANYELKKLETGSFVRALKPGAQTGEPSHYVCPVCFEDHKKSILQGANEEALFYKCPKCKFETEPVVDSRPVNPQVNFSGVRNVGRR